MRMKSKNDVMVTKIFCLNNGKGKSKVLARLSLADMYTGVKFFEREYPHLLDKS